MGKNASPAAATGGGGGAPHASSATNSASIGLAASNNAATAAAKPNNKPNNKPKPFFFRSGPPIQRPPTKSSFDLHSRLLLTALSQSLTSSSSAKYQSLSDEQARLVRRSIGRTIRALERRQERKKKSKSSGVAADALEFYRHALAKARKVRGIPVDEEEDIEEEMYVMEDEVEEDESSEDEEESSDDDDGDEEEEEDSDSSSDDDDDDDDDDDSSTSSAFLRAHNDLCEVCSGVGDEKRPLLCCATCTLVFHQSCHRPILVKEPPDTWSCAYCDDSGVTLHKRDSRERKRASRGVREMKKMQDDLEAEAEAELRRDQEETEARTTPSATPTGGSGTKKKASPTNFFSIRDPTTGRFMTAEKRARLMAALAEEEETTGTRQDLSDLTAEEIARLSGGGSVVVATAAAAPASTSSSPAPTKEAEKLVKEEEEKPAKNDEKLVAATAAAASEAESKKKGGDENGKETEPTDPKQQLLQRESKQQLKGAELKMLLDTMSPENVDLTSSRPRRRERKAPALYDPGDMGGDMDWKSDETGGVTGIQWKDRRSDRRKRKRELLSDVLDRGREAKRQRKKEERKKRRDAKQMEKKKKKKKSSKKKKKMKARKPPKKARPGPKKFDKNSLPPLEKEGAHCHMCYDDDRVDVCLFCACRICFNKGEGLTSLICDGCDSEYHTHCLDPPLAVLPKDDEEWFCPACTNAELRKAKAAADRKAAAERKAKGAVSPAKGKQGGEMRKRGPQSASRSGAKKSRTSVAVDGFAGDHAAVGTTPVTQRSRSGRAVKRTIFHDEIGDGAQYSESGTVSGAGVSDEQRRAQYGAAATSGAAMASSSAHPFLSKSSLKIAVPSQGPAPAGGWGLGSTVPYKYVPPHTLSSIKSPRRKPGARECIQLVRRFGVNVIPEKSVGVLVDYCQRGKLEHLVRMRERLDDHSRFLELQLAELECLVKKKGELKITVPPSTVLPYTSPSTSPRPPSRSTTPPPPSGTTAAIAAAGPSRVATSASASVASTARVSPVGSSTGKAVSPRPTPKP